MWKLCGGVPEDLEFFLLSKEKNPSGGEKERKGPVTTGPGQRLRTCSLSTFYQSLEGRALINPQLISIP